MNYMIGLGSEMRGDDGIGSAIIEYIQQHNLEDNFIAIDFSSNVWGILSLLTDETTTILIIDCSYLGKEPGDWQFFSSTTLINNKVTFDKTSVENHEVSLTQLIHLAKVANYPIPIIKIMGIEPLQTNYGESLSDIVKNKISLYVKEAMAIFN